MELNLTKNMFIVNHNIQKQLTRMLYKPFHHCPNTAQHKICRALLCFGTCVSTHTTRSIMTSWNGNIFRVTCEGTSPVTGDFTPQRPVTRSFGVFFDRHLNKRLNKQSWGWWFETHRAHYDATVMVSSSVVTEMSFRWNFHHWLHRKLSKGWWNFRQNDDISVTVGIVATVKWSTPQLE